MKNIIIFLILATISVWLAVLSVDTKLHIIACDVGQGDAILIQKSQTQILIDSGPNSAVLNCLSKYMSFWDRTIELAILTHPDKDHAGGFVDVFDSYSVSNFLTNDLNNPLFGTQYDQLLRNKVGGSRTTVIHPEKGMVIRLGLIYLDILHPSKDFVSKKTNDYSIVNKLRCADFEAIFTGDIETNLSEAIFDNLEMKGVDYIKISHHGSRNGTSEKLLQTLMPKLAVISVGVKNSYGHPNKEVLDLLNKYNIKTLRTDKSGDIVITP